MFSAKVIENSIGEYDGMSSLDKHIPIITMELRYPKFIHGEFMTHRVFSRNASSSRAIPTKKYLEEVNDSSLRAEPIFWGKNQSGMQAIEELEELEKNNAKSIWGMAAHEAARLASEMSRRGVHKQIVNRIMEPFLHINVVVTSTEWMNFFGLRLDVGAQPEMRYLAELMWKAYCERKSDKKLKPGEWHLPYVTEEDKLVLSKGNAIRVSVARCCRVSYKSNETGKLSTIQEDLALFDRIAVQVPMHASPCEHQATPDEYQEQQMGNGYWKHPELWGNFRQWVQFRKTLSGESLASLPDKYLLEQSKEK